MEMVEQQRLYQKLLCFILKDKQTFLIFPPATD